jgi:hypothetical protein
LDFLVYWYITKSYNAFQKKKGRAGEDNLGNQFTKRYESGAHRRVKSPEGWRTLEGEITGGAEEVERAQCLEKKEK